MLTGGERGGLRPLLSDLKFVTPDIYADRTAYSVTHILYFSCTITNIFLRINSLDASAFYVTFPLLVRSFKDAFLMVEADLGSYVVYYLQMQVFT